MAFRRFGAKARVRVRGVKSVVGGGGRGRGIKGGTGGGASREGGR